MADIANDLFYLCNTYKVVVLKEGTYDAGMRLRFTMADGAKRSFSIDDDNREACLTAAFNWIVTRLEDGDEGLR